MSSPTAGFETIGSYFESLPDPRSTVNRRHLLADVIAISVLAVLGGSRGPTDIHRFAVARREWLAAFLVLANGIPSRDCIRTTLIKVNPTLFQKCFAGWVEASQRGSGDGPFRLIAIDGKTVRGSRRPGADLGAVHIVGAYAFEEGAFLAQVATDRKSNEITAIPELLKEIELEGALVTIDAMGCQKAIVSEIVARGGEYAIAVKDNQPKLHAAIMDHFEKRMDADVEYLAYETCATEDVGHGRRDGRSYYVCGLPKKFPLKAEWPTAQAIAYALRVTEHADGSTSEDVRYYLLSHKLTGKRFAQAVRGHWGIESAHWILDVVFREDDCTAAESKLVDNLSFIRKFAVTMLKRHPAKDSIRGKMTSCLMDTGFLTEVLTLQPLED